MAHTYTLTYARLMTRFHLYYGMKSAQLVYAEGTVDQALLYEEVYSEKGSLLDQV